MTLTTFCKSLFCSLLLISMNYSTKAQNPPSIKVSKEYPIINKTGYKIDDNRYLKWGLSSIKSNPNHRSLNSLVDYKVYYKDRDGQVQNKIIIPIEIDTEVTYAFRVEVIVTENSIYLFYAQKEETTDSKQFNCIIKYYELDKESLKVKASNENLLVIRGEDFLVQEVRFIPSLNNKSLTVEIDKYIRKTNKDQSGILKKEVHIWSEGEIYQIENVDKKNRNVTWYGQKSRSIEPPMGCLSDNGLYAHTNEDTIFFFNKHASIDTFFCLKLNDKELINSLDLKFVNNQYYISGVIVYDLNDQYNVKRDLDLGLFNLYIDTDFKVIAYNTLYFSHNFIDSVRNLNPEHMRRSDIIFYKIKNNFKRQKSEVPDTNLLYNSFMHYDYYQTSDVDDSGEYFAILEGKYLLRKFNGDPTSDDATFYNILTIKHSQDGIKVNVISRKKIEAFTLYTSQIQRINSKTFYILGYDKIFQVDDLELVFEDYYTAIDKENKLKQSNLSSSIYGGTANRNIRKIDETHYLYSRPNIRGNPIYGLITLPNN